MSSLWLLFGYEPGKFQMVGRLGAASGTFYGGAVVRAKHAGGRGGAQLVYVRLLLNGRWILSPPRPGGGGVREWG